MKKRQVVAVSTAITMVLSLLSGISIPQETAKADTDTVTVVDYVIPKVPGIYFGNVDRDWDETTQRDVLRVTEDPTTGATLAYWYDEDAGKYKWKGYDNFWDTNCSPEEAAERPEISAYEDGGDAYYYESNVNEFNFGFSGDDKWIDYVDANGTVTHLTAEDLTITKNTNSAADAVVEVSEIADQVVRLSADGWSSSSESEPEYTLTYKNAPAGAKNTSIKLRATLYQEFFSAETATAGTVLRNDVYAANSADKVIYAHLANSNDTNAHFQYEGEYEIEYWDEEADHDISLSSTDTEAYEEGVTKAAQAAKFVSIEELDPSKSTEAYRILKITLKHDAPVAEFRLCVRYKKGWTDYDEENETDTVRWEDGSDHRDISVHFVAAGAVEGSGGLRNLTMDENGRFILKADAGWGEDNWQEQVTGKPAYVALRTFDAEASAWKQRLPIPPGSRSLPQGGSTERRRKSLQSI